MTEERNATYFTKKEIIAFITAILDANPNAFLHDLVIEDSYIYLPACEFMKVPSTGQWKPF